MISVVVPIYNVEKYLRRALDSILSQTYKDWEAILVDDGSKDNSGNIADEYAKNTFLVMVCCAAAVVFGAAMDAFLLK